MLRRRMADPLGIEGVEGWLTVAQARRLADRAAALDRNARIVEIGSFRGRSTIALARAAPEGVTVVAIDPHAGNDRGPQELDGFAAEAVEDSVVFRRNLAAAGVAERVEHIALPSQEALNSVQGSVDLLFVDGAHRYRAALADLRTWGDRVADGGTMLVHDAFSSVGVTLALGRSTALGTRFRYSGRVGSLAEYRRTSVRGRARAANLVRQVAELPWFAWNVLLKALVVLRLRRGPWPY